MESRLKYESEMVDRKKISPDDLNKIMSQREYITFPFDQGIFIDLSKVSKDTQFEREYIADWALRIYTDLTSLRRKLDFFEK